MLHVLAQVDPKLVDKGVDMAHENPLWVVVYALSAIVATALFFAIWYIRVRHPQEMAARAADRKDRADRAILERRARLDEKAADRQMLQEVALASVSQAHEGARVAVAQAHKEIGDRVQTVSDELSATHQTSQQIHVMLGQVAKKIGIGTAFLLLTSCVSEQQIRQMRSWSSNARRECKVPGACPEEAACIRAIVVATSASAGRTEYNRADGQCTRYQVRP